MSYGTTRHATAVASRKLHKSSSVFGLTFAPAFAAPFTFVGGKAYLEANVNGSANTGGSTALGPANSFVVTNGFGRPLADNRSSAEFSHTTIGTAIDSGAPRSPPAAGRRPPRSG